MQHSPFPPPPPPPKKERKKEMLPPDHMMTFFQIHHRLVTSPYREITSTSIRVSWDRAANDLTTVTGYVLSYVDASGLETETVFSKPCDPNEYTLTGLNPDSYYIRLSSKLNWWRQGFSLSKRGMMIALYSSIQVSITGHWNRNYIQTCFSDHLSIKTTFFVSLEYDIWEIWKKRWKKRNNAFYVVFQSMLMLAFFVGIFVLLILLTISRLMCCYFN